MLVLRYGKYCLLLAFAGVFSYLSYRDPNLLKTLEVYDGTANFLRELEIDDDALTKAVIGTIGDVDSYQLPDAKGYSRYVIASLFHIVYSNSVQTLTQCTIH